MSQDLPVTSYAILGLLTFGDELTGYEIKQRAEFTLRFYWVAPAMSQIYSELRRLTERELVRASSRPDAGRDVTTYAITDTGQETLGTWLEETPAGFPVLKHTVLLRMLMSNASDPAAVTRMLAEYVDELAAARTELAGVREMLRGVRLTRRGLPLPRTRRRLGARLLRRGDPSRAPGHARARGGDALD